MRSRRVSLKPNSKSCALKSRYDSIDVTPKRSSRVGKSANSIPAGLQWRYEIKMNKLKRVFKWMFDWWKLSTKVNSPCDGWTCWYWEWSYRCYCRINNDRSINKWCKSRQKSVENWTWVELKPARDCFLTPGRGGRRKRETAERTAKNAWSFIALCLEYFYQLC